MSTSTSARHLRLHAVDVAAKMQCIERHQAEQMQRALPVMQDSAAIDFAVGAAVFCRLSSGRDAVRLGYSADLTMVLAVSCRVDPALSTSGMVG